MACLKQKSIHNLPDEIIENIIAFLSFDDIFNLNKVGKRLENCAKRVAKKKPFGKYTIKEWYMSICYSNKKSKQYHFQTCNSF